MISQPPDTQDEFDAWLDDSPHSVLVMSIGDECWRSIAYNAAYQAGRDGGNGGTP